jgi:hypothetical protein
MNIEKIHKSFISNKLLFFIIVIGFVAFRLYDANSDWNNPYLWGSTLIQISIALLLLQLNHIFTIIRNRTLLPTLFYLMLAGWSPLFSFDLTGSIAALCIALSYFFFLQSYHEPESQINALNIAILLTLGSLLWNQLLFFFLIFGYGFYRFRSFNFRVFMAGIVGFVAIYLIIFTWSIYQEDWEIFLSLLPDPKILFRTQWPDLTLWEWIVVGFTLFIYILSGINLFVSDLSEKIRTVSTLNYLYFLILIIFFLLLLQSENKTQWALVLFIPLSIQISHLFTLSNKRFVQYLMLLSFFFFFAMGIWRRLG